MTASARVRFGSWIRGRFVEINTELDGEFEERFGLLGDLGLFMSAVRQHEIERDDGGSPEQSPLAARLAIQEKLPFIVPSDRDRLT